MFIVYIIRNDFNKLYVGISQNPGGRLYFHNVEEGAQFTKGKAKFRIGCYNSRSYFVTAEVQMLKKILKKLDERIDEFEWYRFGEDMFFGEAKSICGEFEGVQFRYIVIVAFDSGKNEFQFGISHNKFFFSAYQFLIPISEEQVDFAPIKRLHERLRLSDAKRICHNLLHPDGKWLGPHEGLENFLNSSPAAR